MNIKELFDKNIYEQVPHVYNCDIKPCYNKSWGYDTVLTEEEKERDKTNDYVKSIMYKGADYKGKETRVFAWIGIPPCEKGKKIPAMVLVHGGGGTAFEAWVRKWNARGYAAIAMDTCGCYPLGEYSNWTQHPWTCNSYWGDFQNVDAPLKDQWGYQAVMSVLLGHSLLRSFDCVDETKVGITGISWGGYLTCISAGIDDRFVYANPIYGCGNLNLGSAWTEKPVVKEQGTAHNLLTIGSEKAKKWLSVWDPSQYLINVKIPIHWVCSNIDHAYWPLCVEESRKNCEEYAHLHIKENFGHDHGVNGETQEETRLLAEHYLRGGEKLADIKTEFKDNCVTFSADREVKRAVLYWCDEPVPKYDTFWYKDKIDLNTKSIKVHKDAKVFYVNIWDEKGLITTSRIYNIE